MSADLTKEQIEYLRAACEHALKSNWTNAPVDPKEGIALCNLALRACAEVTLTREQIEAGARELFRIGNERIGPRRWEDVGHYYIAEAEACLTAALRAHAEEVREMVDEIFLIASTSSALGPMETIRDLAYRLKTTLKPS